MELAGYRFEPLVLALVAVAALSTVNLIGSQDRTRYELARHVVLDHTLTVEPGLFDRATFGGRSYSDNAPGMSALLIPVYEAERVAGVARAPRDWSSEGDLSLWLLRTLIAERQHHGFFGIGVPTLTGLRVVLVGNRGLLIFSPVTLAAVVGLWLMWRQRYRAEALVAGGLALGFLMLDGGYFLPYGGGSLGPRFLATALPFLALGLPFAFRRFSRTTLTLAVASAALMTADAATWGVRPFDDSAWVPGRNELAKTVWSWAGLNRIVGAGIVLVCALAAVAVGGISAARRRETAAVPT